MRNTSKININIFRIHLKIIINFVIYKYFKYLLLFIINYFYYIFCYIITFLNGDWGLGIGDWGLGIGPNPQSPIPNPQSPIPIAIIFHL